MKKGRTNVYNGRYLDKMLSVIIVIFVVTLSIGYSAFNTSLNIAGVVSKVRIQKDIRVTGLQYSSSEGSSILNYEEYGAKSLLMGVNLPRENSTVTYKVTVTNLGNTEMGIFSIDNLPSNLTYSINGYNLKDKICDDSGKCSLGITKDFYITIGYASNGYNSTITEYNLKLNINFKEICTVTYVDSGGTSVPATQEVISGETLTLSNNIPTKEGYIFKGWAISSSGNVEYQPGAKFTVNSSVTLYAIWSRTLVSVMKSVAKSDAGIDFSQKPVAGVYTVNTTIGNTNPIYYYRGAVTNNNVLFANKCWKAVRSTETGGVKLVYNGMPTNGQCLGTNPTIGTSAFNTNYTTVNDVRYLYADGSSSTIKRVVDIWYENNLANYANEIEDIPWCMDLNFETESDGKYYGAWGRNIDEPIEPSLSCPAEYQLKVSASNTGLKLKYPVALLTADEITLAGSGRYGYSTDAYLNIGSYWWALSPYSFHGYVPYAHAFCTYSDGHMHIANVGDTYGVRPSISLAPGTEITEDGDGTATNPYVVISYAVSEDNTLISRIKSVAQSDADVNFEEAPEAGVYTVNSTMGNTNPIHYYRGAVTNNNVLFADKCWKIVRTTETGGVKLIYNGTPTEGKCLGTNPTIGGSVFNTGRSTVSDVRYIYADGSSSTIKGVIDTWYENNLDDYTSKLEDTPWCMDLDSKVDSDGLYYGAVGRNIDKPIEPSVTCKAEYQLKVSATDPGLKLKYPIALLTADEATLAGSGKFGYSSDVYLNIDSKWWTLSPYSFHGMTNYQNAHDFRVAPNGILEIGRVDLNDGFVRPSISLAPGTEITDSGDGTADSPYVVK